MIQYLGKRRINTYDDIVATFAIHLLSDFDFLLHVAAAASPDMYVPCMYVCTLHVPVLEMYQIPDPVALDIWVRAIRPGHGRSPNPDQ